VEGRIDIDTRVIMIFVVFIITWDLKGKIYLEVL